MTNHVERLKSSKIVVYICILVFVCRKTGTPSGKSAPRVGALPAEGPPEGQMEVVFHKSRPYRMKNPTGWKTLPDERPYLMKNWTLPQHPTKVPKVPYLAAQKILL